MNTQTKARSEDHIAGEALAPQLPSVVDIVPPRITAVAVARHYPPKIAKALLAITREVGTITKEGENKFHKYFYQKWEDVLDTLSPLLAKHNLLVIQSEITRGLFDNDRLISITYEFTIVNEDGDVWPERPIKTAIARLVDQKGVADDKAANKCHTAGQKYFYLQLFKIKTRDAVADDADGDTQPKERPKAPNPNTQAPADDAPRLIPTNRETTFSGWSEEYIKAVFTATTPEQIKEWEHHNEGLLAVLQEKAPQVFDGLVKKVSAHAGKLVQGSKSVTPKAPNPNAGMVPHEFANWRATTEEALNACNEATTLAEIRTGVDAAKGKVSINDWQAVALVYKQTVDRIVMGK